MIQFNAWQILRRQFLTFMLVVLAGLAITVLVIVYAPRKYHSHAKFLLKLGRENVAIDPTASTTGEMASLHRTQESEVLSTVNGMRSRRILEKVLEQIGPEPILKGSLKADGQKQSSLPSIKSYIKNMFASLDPIDDNEKAILALQSGLSIEAERDSSVIDIWFRTKTPELARLVVDTWVKAYQAEHARISLSAGSFTFFQKQEKQLLDDLERSRATLQSKKSQSGVLTIEGGQQILERQMEQARLSRMDVESQLAGARSRLDSLATQQTKVDSQVLTGEATSSTNDARQQMRDRLYALEIEERGLTQKYGPDHPSLQAVRQQLIDARKMYETNQDATRETVQGLNPLYITIAEQLSLERANVDALVSKLTTIDSTIVLLAKQLNELNQYETELASLQRQVDVLELQYKTQFIKREQSRLAEELQQTNISNLSLIQDPSLERRPVTPNKTLCALLGCLGSVLAAFGLSAWREAGYQMKQVEPSRVPELGLRAITTEDTRASASSSDRRQADLSGSLMSSASESRLPR